MIQGKRQCDDSAPPSKVKQKRLEERTSEFEENISKVLSAKRVVYGTKGIQIFILLENQLGTDNHTIMLTIFARQDFSASDGWRVVGGGWWVAGGGWRVVGGG